MSETNRTVIASTKVSRDLADFLDDRASHYDTTRSEVLRRLSVHYRDAHETGLSCPHCKNDLQIDL